MIVLPQAIEQYLSTNLDQPYIRWTATSSYPVDARVLYKNYIYQNIVDNNLNVQPDLNTGKWLLVAVDNAYAGIDLNSSTATMIDEDLDQIELEFSAIGFHYLAFGGVLGGVLTVNEYDSLDTLIATNDYVIGSIRINADNWYDYYFTEIPSTEGAGFPVDILVDVIQPNTAKIGVILTRDGQLNAYISSMVGGQGYSIGSTEYGVKLGLLDYSIKETDNFGITTLERRRSREYMECDIVEASTRVSLNMEIMKRVLGTALMFIADPSTDSKFNNLITLGYVDSYDTYLNNGVIARTRMRIEEVL